MTQQQDYRSLKPQRKAYNTDSFNSLNTTCGMITGFLIAKLLNQEWQGALELAIFATIVWHQWWVERQKGNQAYKQAIDAWRQKKDAETEG